MKTPKVLPLLDCWWWVLYLKPEACHGSGGLKQNVVRDRQSGPQCGLVLVALMDWSAGFPLRFLEKRMNMASNGVVLGWHGYL
jgi:hypothetical protein